MKAFLSIVCAGILSLGVGCAAVEDNIEGARFNPNADYSSLVNWIEHGAYGTAIEQNNRYHLPPFYFMHNWEEKILNRFIKIDDEWRIFDEANSETYMNFSRELFDGSEQIAKLLREIAQFLKSDELNENECEYVAQEVGFLYGESCISSQDFWEYYGRCDGKGFFQNRMKHGIYSGYFSFSVQISPWFKEEMPLVIEELCEDLYEAWGGQYTTPRRSKANARIEAERRAFEERFKENKKGCLLI